jgi:2-polyprenyl-6-methoxyphenol hydroxylase-like FAD-dependent oxidoreductase
VAQVDSLIIGASAAGLATAAALKQSAQSLEILERLATKART